MIDDDSQDPSRTGADRRRRWDRYGKQMLSAATTAAMQGGDEVFVPPDDFPVLVSQAVIIPYGKTDEGRTHQGGYPAVARHPHRRSWKTRPACTRSIRVSGKKSSPRLTTASGLFDEVTLTTAKRRPWQRPDRREEGVRGRCGWSSP